MSSKKKAPAPRPEKPIELSSQATLSSLRRLSARQSTALSALEGSTASLIADLRDVLPAPEHVETAALMPASEAAKRTNASLAGELEFSLARIECVDRTLIRVRDALQLGEPRKAAARAAG